MTLTRVCGLLLSVGLATSPVWSAVELNLCFTSESELGEWMTFYYQHASPEKLPCALSYFADSPLYEHGSGRMPFVHFYAAILARDANMMSQLFDVLSDKASEHARVMALHVFWVADTQESHQLLTRGCRDWATQTIERICTRTLQQQMTPVLERPLDDPAVLDDLWATFFATGDEQVVRRIASIVHLVKDGHGMDIVLGGAARWSLTANARQHPRVRGIVENLAAHAEGAQKEILEEVLMN